MNNADITIVDPITKKETILNINDIAYVDEGKNTKGEACVWLQMRSGESHSFKIDYDTFISYIESRMVQSNWNGICFETK
jgi:hypothetical protein